MTGVQTCALPICELTLKPDAYVPIVKALKEGPKSFEELAALPDMANQNAGATVQSVLLLLHTGNLSVGPYDPPHPEVAQRLNRILAKSVCEGAPYAHVAVPSLGGGLGMSDIDFMMLDCWYDHRETGKGQITIKQLATGLRQRLDRLNRRLSTKGVALDEAATETRIKELAGIFLETAIPAWKRFGAVA